MANGSGVSGHWKDWLLGLLVPTCISLMVVVWNTREANTIQLDVDARTMQRSISDMQQDIAVIKQQISYINERERDRSSMSNPPVNKDDYRRR